MKLTSLATHRGGKSVKRNFGGRSQKEVLDRLLQMQESRKKREQKKRSA